LSTHTSEQYEEDNKWHFPIKNLFNGGGISLLHESGKKRLLKKDNMFAMLRISEAFKLCVKRQLMNCNPLGESFQC